jgi:hypothetical protein
VMLRALQIILAHAALVSSNFLRPLALRADVHECAPLSAMLNQTKFARTTAR